jgi:formate hydrogenlyase subunit 4
MTHVASTAGKVHIGERVFTKKKPTQFATIIDGETVEYRGEKLPINTWGQQMTGWSSISIYNSVFLARTGQPLKNLREQEVS